MTMVMAMVMVRVRIRIRVRVRVGVKFSVGVRVRVRHEVKRDIRVSLLGGGGFHRGGTYFISDLCVARRVCLRPVGRTCRYVLYFIFLFRSTPFLWSHTCVTTND